jgi:O-antigen/teichoic acid export membrane protein
MGIARVIAKNTFFNSIYANFDWAINFAVSIILARGLGTEEYGLYCYLLWFFGFAELAVNLGLGDMLMRFIADALGRQRADEPKSLIRLALSLRGSAALVVCVVILIFSSYWARTLTKSSNQIDFLLLAFALIPNVLTNLLMSLFAGFQKYEYRAYTILCTSPLRLVIIPVLMILDFGVREVLILNLGIWLFGMFIGLFLLRRLIPLKDILSPSPLDKTRRNEALKYSLSRAGIYGLNYFAGGSIAVLFIGLYLSVEEVGFYSLAARIPSTAMTIIPAVFVAVLVPVVSEQVGKGDMNKVRTIYMTSARYLGMLALPMAAAGIAMAKPFVKSLYGVDYAPTLVPMQVMFVPAALGIMAEGVSNIILGINKPVFLVKVGLLLAALNVGLCVWLTSRYGVLGAAIGSSVPRIVYLVLCIWYVYKQIRTPWPLGSMVKVTFASLVLGLALFCLQKYLGGVLSLVLALPLGLVLYTAVLLALGAVGQEDFRTIRGIQDSLPSVLRKVSAVVIRLAEKVAVRRL